jgi:AP-4 complex subunit mu-1
MALVPLSQFYILSPRGDTIIAKDYRGGSDATPARLDTFFRRVRFWESGDPPPCISIDGVNFLYVKKNGLLFGVTTRWNCSPSQVLELLNRLTKVFKDYCGILSEEAIRKNFILIYELLDEALDYGYPQATSTEHLKSFVYNEPIAVEVSSSGSGSMRPKIAHLSGGSKTTPPTAAHKPIGGGDSGHQRNEIFVDIIEKLNILFGADGRILNHSIDGSIQMKSYLSGNPELRLALNEDMVIGKGGGYSGYGAVTLDDCNFHECVRLDEFETIRQLSFIPPEGEFTCLNYRITAEFRAPFRLFATITEVDPLHVELLLVVRADMPDANHGSSVTLRIPMPRGAISVGTEVEKSGGTGDGEHRAEAEYSAADRRILWSIKKFPGGSEQSLRARITLKSPYSASTRKEIGPVSMQFEVPMYNVSGLQVRYLKIAEASKSYNPYRWVRYVTKSSSYVIRC